MCLTEHRKEKAQVAGLTLPVQGPKGVLQCLIKTPST